MTDYAYNPDDLLPSTLRSIGSYVQAQLAANPLLGVDQDDNPLVVVEMSQPDTATWTKATPLARSIVHFELDDAPEMRIGFGITSTYPDPEDDGSTFLSEASRYHFNFDLGIWVSAETGGPPKRAQIRQALMDIFGRPGGRSAFNLATDGLQVVSYGGGGDALDRINDVPLFRTVGITLVVSGFGRLTATDPAFIASEVTQYQQLTNEDDEHILTDEEPWT